MGARECGQDPGKNCFCEVLKQTESHRTADAGSCHRKHRFVVEREHSSGIVEENGAGGGQCYSPPISLEGSCADHFFKSIHLQADRGLGSPNSYRRLLEAPGLGSPKESSKQIQIKEWFTHS